MEIFELVCDHCDKLIFRNYCYADHQKAMSQFDGAVIISGKPQYTLDLCPACLTKFDNHIIKFLDHESEV